MAVRNLDGGSTTAGKRSSGEFIGQFTRGGVVGVVSAKRLHNTEQVVSILANRPAFRGTVPQNGPLSRSPAKKQFCLAF